MTREAWGYLVYGVWFLAWVALELAGWRGFAPWPTLSRTAWNLRDRFPNVVYLWAVGFGLLLMHLTAQGRRIRRKEKP